MDEEVNQDKNGEADGMNLEVDSKDEVMHLNERSVIFKEEMVGGRERVTFKVKVCGVRFSIRAKL